MHHVSARDPPAKVAADPLDWTTFSGPNGWKYSSRVRDAKALSTVKVGDKIDITWTTALLVSLQKDK